MGIRVYLQSNTANETSPPTPAIGNLFAYICMPVSHISIIQLFVCLFLLGSIHLVYIYTLCLMDYCLSLPYCLYCTQSPLKSTRQYCTTSHSKKVLRPHACQALSWSQEAWSFLDRYLEGGCCLLPWYMLQTVRC